LLNHRILFACLSLAVVAGSVVPLPSVAATATKAASKDACTSKPSKWQQLQCENYNHSAPGDEYFGRMKMSYLGINNTFHDEAIRAGAYTTDQGVINKVNFADEALQQWSHKYPNDPQLARTYFLAIAVYKRIYVKQYQDKAWTYMHVLTARFGNTYFGKLEKQDISRGFTEHYFALAELCPTPIPSGVPVPSNTPAATPTPQPRPGQPKVDLITPQCVQPQPTPAPELEATPSAGPEATPPVEPSATATP
jgi:hypothetical protein